MESRKRNSVRNFIFEIGGQTIQTVIPFISRIVFIKTLGEAYLGVSSLFTSILTVLSLAELGIGEIVIYSMYEPLAKQDYEKVVALIDYYKSIYCYIAMFVFAGGMMLVPVLPVLINLPADIPNIRLYYILYVINSSVSYLFIYKTAIITADQKRYVISEYTTLFTIILHTSQCVILIVKKNFLLFLMMQILCTLMQNIVMSHKANKLYHLKAGYSSISRNEKKEILSNTRYMFMYKVGSTFLNMTDSIFISALVGTITVGYYTNYNNLVGLMERFAGIISNAVIASVGNLNITGSKVSQKRVFDVLIFIYLLIATIELVGYCTTANCVIAIWLGKSFVIDYRSVLALTVRFYLSVVLNPIWIYRNTFGIFKKTKGILFYAGLLNLVLSFFFGKWYGLAGILFATSVARILTSFWYEPMVLYKEIFSQSSVKEYFLKVGFSFVLGCFCILLINWILSPISNVWVRMLVAIVLSICLPSAGIMIRYHKSDEWKYLHDQIIVTIIRKIGTKINHMGKK